MEIDSIRLTRDKFLISAQIFDKRQTAAYVYIHSIRFIFFTPLWATGGTIPSFEKLFRLHFIKRSPIGRSLSVRQQYVQLKLLHVQTSDLYLGKC